LYEKNESSSVIVQKCPTYAYMVLAFPLTFFSKKYYWDFLFKNHFLKYVCTLMNYILHTHTFCILENPRTYVSYILDNLCLPPKIARNLEDFMGYWRFPNHFTHCSPSPNRMTIFLLYKRLSWGIISIPRKRIRKLCQNPFPFLAQVLHPFLSFGLSIPLNPFLLIQPFPLSQVISCLWEVFMGLMHLEPR